MGQVDMLVGSNLTSLMPKDKYEVENLRIKESKFGSGYCMQGSSRAIDSLIPVWSTNATHIEDIAYTPGIRRAKIQTMQCELIQDVTQCISIITCSNSPKSDICAHTRFQELLPGSTE